MSNCSESASEPLGTTSAKALACNAETLDNVANGQLASYPNRIGNQVKSLKGITDEANAAIGAIGGVDNGFYINDPLMTEYNQYVKFDRAGTIETYKVKTTVPLPYQINSTATPDPLNDVNLQPFNVKLSDQTVISVGGNSYVELGKKLGNFLILEDFSSVWADYLNGSYSHRVNEDATFQDYSPKNNSRLIGDNGAVITVATGQAAIKPALSDDFKYTLLQGIRAQGQGKVADGTTFIDFVGTYNHVFNTMIGMRLEGFDTCINYSAGWGNTTIGVDCRGSVTGVKYTVSPIQAGWAGSGQTSIACSYQYNTTGIDESGVPWANTYINTILEGNDLGMLAEGNNTVMISPWFELNTKDIQIERGITIIGGGNMPTWTLGDVSIFNANEMVSLLNGAQFTLTRGLPDGSDALFHADGKGVKQVQSSQGSVNTETDRMRIGGSVFTQPGGTLGYNLALHGAYFTSRFVDIYDDSQESKIVDIQLRAQQSLSGTGGAVGQIDFVLGKYENVGLPFNDQTTPLSLKPGVISTGGDAVNDLGEPTHRINNSYFAVSPTVGSSVHIKKDIKSIPQELCDLSLNTELMQYKLKAGTSGRNHYGIIIDDEFLSKLRSAANLDECGAFCQSVFKDSSDNPVDKHIGGITELIQGDDTGASYTYTLPSTTCEVEIRGLTVSILDGVMLVDVDGAYLSNGVIFDSAGKEEDNAKLLAEAKKVRADDLESRATLAKKITDEESDLNGWGEVKSPLTVVAMKEALSLIDKKISEPLAMTPACPPSISVTYGGVRLGDFWQVRYDEWQNIMLEAHRRERLRMSKLINSLSSRVDALESL